jgi:hypothetical protein
MLADAGPIRPPWYGYPYRLVSWWDMETFSAGHFFDIGGAFRQLDTLLSGELLGVRLSETDAKWFYETLHALSEDCRSISLIESAKCVERLALSAVAGTDCATLRIRIDDLRALFQSEMDSNLFLWVMPHEADYFIQPKPLMGAVVDEKFLSARHEIQEAGKCLALARSTACVFHLMRVLEAAIDVIEADIQINPDSPTWNAYLNGFTKHALRKYPDDGSEINREWRAFYFGVEGHLRAIKNMWRNETMHNIARVYSEEQAKDIFNLVAAFMRHLATKLKE